MTYLGKENNENFDQPIWIIKDLIERIEVANLTYDELINLKNEHQAYICYRNEKK